ncbi:MAG: CDP-alcohol phosphatidyltransferase family protein, partial [Methylococcales bacterium]
MSTIRYKKTKRTKLNFLFTAKHPYNLANLFTFVNIASGILAIYFIVHNDFKTAIILAWIAGAFDIFDGKIARKYNLSTEFGIQIDSFADFISFVLVPTFLIHQAIFNSGDTSLVLVAIIQIYYVVSALRRLINFNIDADAGGVEKYFTGVPTPLGAILLWFLFLTWQYEIIQSGYIALAVIAIIGYLLNSKLKIRHP